MKLRVVSSFLILGYVSVSAQDEFDIPPFLKLCHQKDSQLNECVKRSVEALRPHLKSGIEALNIPPCEPLRIPQIEISQAAGPVSINSVYKNIRVLGGTDFVLKSVKIDMDKDRIRLKLYIPRLQMDSDYSLRGRILMLPVIGRGQARGNYSDIDVIVTVQGERYQNSQTNRTHFRVAEFYVDFDVGHASIHLDNLFNGEETLAHAMNLFLNDNWKTVAAEMKPALEDTVSNLFKEFSNNIYAKYPIDVLLPP
ncbi:protein takeout-like [Venturia canescens]|uniref:protein takeout-like n=1 Tax=Venturia canescens TaxID=32260 RepID=UPI001C9C8E97|nr:protein takeout-like [Venturia canescens]